MGKTHLKKSTFCCVGVCFWSTQRSIHWTQCRPRNLQGSHVLEHASGTFPTIQYWCSLHSHLLGAITRCEKKHRPQISVTLPTCLALKKVAKTRILFTKTLWSNNKNGHFEKQKQKNCWSKIWFSYNYQKITIRQWCYRVIHNHHFVSDLEVLFTT